MNTWYLLAIVPLAFWLWGFREYIKTSRKVRRHRDMVLGRMQDMRTRDDSPLYIRPRLRNEKGD